MRQKLTAELSRSDGASTSDKDQHLAALARQRHIEKLKDALNISKSFEGGAAFDFELQEKKRLEKIAERDQKRKEEKRARKEAKRQQEREALQMQLAAVTQSLKEQDEKVAEEKVLEKAVEEPVKTE